MSKQESIKDTTAADMGITEKKAEDLKNLSPDNDPNFK